MVNTSFPKNVVSTACNTHTTRMLVFSCMSYGVAEYADHQRWHQAMHAQKFTLEQVIPLPHRQWVRHTAITFYSLLLTSTSFSSSSSSSPFPFPFPHSKCPTTTTTHKYACIVVCVRYLLVPHVWDPPLSGTTNMGMSWHKWHRSTSCECNAHDSRAYDVRRHFWVRVSGVLSWESGKWLLSLTSTTFLLVTQNK